jgi:AraC-like DNA-binding protein
VVTERAPAWRRYAWISWSHARTSKSMSATWVAKWLARGAGMRLCFAPPMLSVPSSRATPSCWACLPAARGRAQTRHRDENFAERVRVAIQQKLTGRRPTIDGIACALHVSARTLARHDLNNSVLELNEVAYLLGYEDGNSFVRAFQTWEGVPPARWRAKQRARPASQSGFFLKEESNAKEKTGKKQS